MEGCKQQGKLLTLSALTTAAKLAVETAIVPALPATVLSSRNLSMACSEGSTDMAQCHVE